MASPSVALPRCSLCTGACWALLVLASTGHAQEAQLEGQLQHAGTGQPLHNAQVWVLPGGQRTCTDSLGHYRLPNLQARTYTLFVAHPATDTATQRLKTQPGPNRLDLRLMPELVLNETVVHDHTGTGFGLSRLNAVQGTEVFSGKKTEVVVLDNLCANLATNNPRQIFGRVAGLNIWESDGNGLQLSVGGRGLSPNRMEQFNTRQNGYDIAADALGYPESYYTPPTEALQRIEVVRGAASLQYGTQFGGLLNFVFRQPSAKPLAVRTRLSGGSFGFLNAYQELSGTRGKWSGLVFGQFRRSDGWRPNSGFNQYMGHAHLRFAPNPRWSLKLETTHMHYLAQQPGGLTDAQFETDPGQSQRERNWFRVDWHLAALHLDGELGPNTRLNARVFGLLGGRESVGWLGRIDRADPGTERDLLSDDYLNLGTEVRLLHRYNLGKQPQVFSVGLRAYEGRTDRQQGYTDDGNGPSFRYLRAENLAHSRFRFPNANLAGFAEHVFRIGNRISIVPGMRWEYIVTRSEGEYTQIVTDFAGNVLLNTRIGEQRRNPRSFPLFGLGASWKATEHTEVYANLSQNYRSVTFNDLRVINPNYRVDPNLTDENGFTADLGLRGTVGRWLQYDATAFWLAYNNRIGAVLQTDTSNFTVYRFQTNIADAYTYGLELGVEARLLKLLLPNTPHWEANLFANTTLLRARYAASDEPAIDGNEVELVPPLLLRAGLQLRWKNLRAAGQVSHTAGHFSDATNAESTPSAVEGLIPAYTVADLSLAWTWKHFTLGASINNLFNTPYFTRRAAGYPGPGILPADPRSVFATLEFVY